MCAHACVYGAVLAGAGVSAGERKGVAGGRKRKELTGRGLELSTPLREMPQTYFSRWCLGSRGFMGPPSPTMILVALNCVSPLIDAEPASSREAACRLGRIWSLAQHECLV